MKKERGRKRMEVANASKFLEVRRERERREEWGGEIVIYRRQAEKVEERKKRR